MTHGINNTFKTVRKNSKLQVESFNIVLFWSQLNKVFFINLLFFGKKWLGTYDSKMYL